MNKLQFTNGNPSIVIPLYILTACLLGLMIPFQPMLMAVVITGFMALLGSILYPERMSYVLCISTVISIQYIAPFTMMGFDFQSVHKIGILILLLPAMIHYGIHRKLTMPIIALLGLLTITFLFSDRHPLLTMSAPVVAFVGLAIPFVFLIIRWKPSVARQHIIIICFMPLLSIAFGTLFHLLSIHPLFVMEFTGAFRLQGANIPAHLGFLAFIALLVSIMEIKRNPQRMTFFYMMMGINFVILLLTGTRGPLISALIIIIVFFYDLSRQFVEGRVNRIFPLFGFVVVLALSIIWQLENFRKRTFVRSTDEFIDTSGRLEAWTYFLDGVKESPWFGRGLGSVLVSNDGSLYQGFVVPHNEYIRFYYDSGIIGAILLFLSLLFVFRQVFIRLHSDHKLYFIAFIMGFLVYTISDNTLSTLQFIVPFCMYLSALRNLNDHPISKEVIRYG